MRECRISKIRPRALQWIVLCSLVLSLGGCSKEEADPDLKWDPPPYYAQEQYVNVSGHRVCYLTGGPKNAKPIVFVHGLGGNVMNWWDQYEYFTGEYRVVVPDLWGHGKSERGPQVIYSIEEFAGQVLGLMDALGIKKASLVGNSMGGMVAARIAVNNPERVEMVVLCDSAGTGEAGFIGFLAKVAEKWVVKAFMNPELHAGDDIKPKARREFQQSFKGTAEEQLLFVALRDSLRSVIDNPMGPELAEIKARTLIIYGDDDFVIPKKAIELMQGWISDSVTYSVHKGGHVPMMIKPDEFNCATDNFLKGKDPAPCAALPNAKP